MDIQPHKSLGLLLHDASRLLRKRFEMRASVYGLSSAQWRLLVHVNFAGELSQARLCEVLEIEPISVSRLVDRMEQAGWVIRKSDKDDRRVRLVSPTPKAREAFETVRAVANDVYDEALAGLTPDERATLLSLIETVVKNLSGDDPGVPAPISGSPESKSQ